MGFLYLSERRSEPYYRKAVQLAPQRPEFHRWRGQSLVAMHRFDEALQEYRRAVAIDPVWGLNTDHLAGAYFLLGRDEDGRQAVARFLSLSTDARTKLQLRAGLAELERRPGQAARIFRDLARVYPQERQMQFKMSSSLAMLGERGPARTTYADDPRAAAVLAGDWPRLAQGARLMGRNYWDYGAYLWHTGELLLASGHGDVIVQQYREAKPLLAKGDLDLEAVARPETILALRRAGMVEDAARLQRFLRAHALSLPERGSLGDERRQQLLMLAALEGDRAAVLDQLDRITRTRPLALAVLPAMALRYEPVLAPYADDPRFRVAEERIRIAVNRERLVASLPPLSRDAWISDQKTLLTKN
jgi:hypothetical protein